MSYLKPFGVNITTYKIKVSRLITFLEFHPLLFTLLRGIQDNNVSYTSVFSLTLTPCIKQSSNYPGEVRCHGVQDT